MPKATTSSSVASAGTLRQTCTRRSSRMRRPPRRSTISAKESAPTLGGFMRAVDTNVLVRLLTRDDRAQLAAAEDFVSSGAWVSHVVLVETIWVLESVYALPR